MDDPADLPPRALVVNLSARLRVFHAALARSNQDDLTAEYREAHKIGVQADRSAKGRRKK
jgi:hypothetical protein